MPRLVTDVRVLLTAALLLAWSVAAFGQRGRSILASTDCVQESVQASCADYQYPAASAHTDLDDLCIQMSFMPACSVYARCNATQGDQSSGDTSLCDPLNLLATICKLDGMSGMRGCASYNKLCQAGTAVRACASATGLTMLPTTVQVNSEVKSICEEMSMEGCEKCMPSWKAGQTYADCDLLSVYGQLCTSMPNMRQCALYKQSCAGNKQQYFCAGSSASGGNAPVMLMYFNEKLPFYLLFRTWTPSTSASYAGAWFAIFFLGILYEAVVTMKVVLEFRWDCERSHVEDQKELLTFAKRVSHSFSITDIYRGIVQFIVVGLAYLLMLAAMSFNLGIFFAVVSGIAVGTVIFGRRRRCIQADEPCCPA